MSHNEPSLPTTGQTLPASQEPIAIVGSACRFPGGASSPSKLWDLLRHPRDVLRTIAEERFNADAFYHPDGTHHGTSNVTESYLLEEDPRVFDAGFFNIKPVEAHATDPQHRMLLETVYEALESAGLAMEGMAGSSTAVYVGQMWCDYNDHLQRDIDSLPTYAGVGTARSILSNRISHFFDWHGPSATIDTACSSSLVAVYNAVMTLRNGDAQVAVVAGANIILTPEPYIGESKLKMLSHDSRSRMWDKDAKGYARGDGVAALILKPLSVALADGDHIESVIRECLVNQDGRTPEGITVPSSEAQAELIRKTYSKAGLDATNPEERCQFFEAHGTGTGAGDPREARAIASAFFGPSYKSTRPLDNLYVGSIKTVIGHTEGTAGIAGVMKASLAIQHGEIPPNLLFNNLSPAVAPFYNNLEIPTSIQKWPVLAPNVPRRASVNSFGFGGTNAHVIIESFEQPATISQKCTEIGDSHDRLLSPFVFSASSEKSLRAILQQYTTYLQASPDTNIRDLHYTLTRRSVLQYRVAFSAQSVDDLVAELTKWLKQAKGNPDDSRIIRSVGGTGESRVLGIFTGQGAQWAMMGAELINSFPTVKNILLDLDRSLSSLPKSDRPQWSIVDELVAQGESRVNQASFSQPLCTAVQVVLVNLLRSASIHFKAVVGHSSGEIAAAYAAGFITASDAIRIAYYRGRATALAGSNRPQKGAMMAIGTTLDDAHELCNVDTLENRVWVAAVNSPTSITLSGDADAMEEARKILEDEGKFARLLKVDKAYHSEHMLPCVEPYLQAMEDCGIRPLHTADRDCAWFSSVRADTKMQSWDHTLRGQYWCDNMALPVLFSNAIQNAFENIGSFDAVVEVGPHAALKGPFLQTRQDLSQEHSLPTYTGVLSRGNCDIKSFAQGIGALWQSLPPGSIDLLSLNRQVTTDDSPPRLLKGLPSYPWDHDRIYWHESRLTRAYRTRQNRPHPLLGTPTSDGLATGIQWRNLLRMSEIPWVKGHTLQGQVVFPAAGYIVAAMEAGLAMAGDRAPQLLAVRNVVINRALTLEDDADVETLVSLANIRNEDADTLIADFEFHASLRQDASNLTLLATASVRVSLESSSSYSVTDSGLLPPREDSDQPNLLEVNTTDFYEFLEEVGYGYTGPFRALNSMRRKLDYGTGSLELPVEDSIEASMMIHPAFLDASFQAIFLAMGWPRDAGLVEVFVPIEFHSIKVDVPKWREAISRVTSASDIVFDSRLRQLPESITGDVEIFSAADDGVTLIQVENIKVVPFSPAAATANRQLFSKTMYWPVKVDGLEASGGRVPSDKELAMAMDLERVAIYFLRAIEDEFPEQQLRTDVAPHHQYFFEFSRDILSRVSAGTMPYAEKEWIKDSWNDIAEIFHRYPDSLDLQLMQKVGTNMAAAIRGEANLVEILFKDDFMDRFYAGALGLDLTMDWLGRIAVQLSRRYPHMKILELGAGTGGATKSVLRHIGDHFSSYTFTDISAGFFQTATTVFKSPKMIFKVLDAEKDVIEQGFEEGVYDLIVASNVLHATAKLDETLRNTRRLLKPGGYLLIAEVTCADVVRVRLPFSALPGWWRGRDDGRTLTATIDTTEWHQRLSNTGFSGIDAVTPEFEPLAWPSVVILSQAVDDRVAFLRQPLHHQPSKMVAPADTCSATEEQKLVLVGGQTMHSCRLLGEVSRILAPWFAGTSIIRSRSLRELARSSFLGPRCAVINFSDLDSPALDGLTDETFAGLKKLVELPHSILWITSGCREGSPEMNMSVGLGRVLLHEMPGLGLQFFDIDNPFNAGAPRLIAETFLRWRALGDYMSNDLSPRPILWAKEHELVSENDTLKFPRIAYDEKMNLRYNASRKLVTKDTDFRETPVRLRRAASSWKFEISAALPFSGSLTAYTDSFKCVLSSAVPCYGGLYAVLATRDRDDALNIALSTVNGSSMQEKDFAAKLAVDVTRENGIRYLSRLMTNLQAANIVNAVLPGSYLLLHEPDPFMLGFIRMMAEEKNLIIACSTSGNKGNLNSQKTSRDGKWISIQPHTSARVARSRLPPDINVFVDCLPESNKSSLPEALQHALPPTCLRLALRNLIHCKTNHAPTAQTMLSAAVALIGTGENLTGSFSTGELNVCTKTPIELDLARDLDHGLSTIIDWRPNPTSIVSALVPPVDAYLSFKPERTYVLFGLTSDLGQSLCDWMASHGARHFVMTSRCPAVNTRWLSAKEQAGITVKVFANDITDEQALREVVEEIRRTMPPIAGIANGAMVLRDKLFLDMPLEMMIQTLHTKVKGSIYLDSIFGDKSQYDLDFFIFFSSIAAVTGNRAQSNYSAANMFMTALASKRRARGLAASVMHIGAIMGVGYMARNLSRAILDNLWSAGATWISEKDFHSSFAEAVLAGHPKNGFDNAEIIVGLRQLVQGRDSSDKVLVMDDPRFSHLVIKDFAQDTDSLADTGVRRSTQIKRLLKEAKTPRSIEKIVREGFIAKLIGTLQLDPEMPEADILASRADELGVDSLVSVDFRAWFSGEMSVEMPVLKLLGGSTVLELIEFSLEKLPAETTPNVCENTEGEEDDTPLVHEPKVESPSPGAVMASSLSASPRVINRKQLPTLPPLEMCMVPTKLAMKEESLETSSSSRSSPSLLDDRFTDSECEGVISLSSSARSVSPETSSFKKDSLGEVEKRLPMSTGQSRFWFLKHYVQDKSAFNITFWAHLQGKINIDHLTRAFDAVTNVHESLRTSFTTNQDNIPIQLVRPKSHLRLEHRRIHDETEAQKLFVALKSHEYNPEGGEFLKFNLLTHTNEAHYLVIGYHHIAMDGISLEVFLNDIQTIYFGQPLPAPVQYSDYCTKQAKMLQSDALSEERRYWATELSNPAPEPLPLLPFAKVAQRRPLEQYSHEYAQGRISMAVIESIKAVCRHTKTNLFHFLLNVYAVLLSRFLDLQDLCIGMADSGRDMGAFSHSIGMYLNLLPLRLTTVGSQRFTDLLDHSKRKVQAAMAHGRLPFDHILQSAGVERSNTHNPLFQAFINFRPGVSDERTFCGCKGRGEDWVSGATSYDIMLDIIENPGNEAAIRFDVQKTLYSKDNAQTLLNSYLALLEAFANKPSLFISEPSLYPTSEVERALALGRGQNHVSGWPDTVMHRIEKIAAQQPNSIAISNGYASGVTYSTMQRRVQAISAAILKKIRVTEGGLVAVFCKPSIDAVCSLLAVMRVGLAYVPLDTTLPSERLQHLVGTINPILIITHDETIDSRGDLGSSADEIPFINVSHERHLLNASVPIAAKTQDAMAVHFTSGTTGTPKGVVLYHGAVVNVIEACADIYRTASNVVLQQTAFNFDMALWQILVTLCSGGKLVIVPQNKRLDMATITRLICQEEVTLTIATPSEYAAWLLYGSEDLRRSRQWQIAVIGGEHYSSQVDSGLRSFQLPQLRLMNFYGPSEVSFVSHYTEVFPYMVSENHPVPVGVPLRNYAAYVLDSKQRPVAPDMAGEVYIAGAGVCSGYLGNPSLTGEKFFNDPFVRSELARSRGWTRMYKTGDRGKINPDGTLSILGRIEGDTQVKIRGVRMELEEIERAILRSSNGLLEQVVVTTRGEGESRFLVAHALLSNRERDNKHSQDRNNSQLLSQILQNLTSLPKVMRPASIIPIDRLPVTIHKKIDRRAVAALPAGQLHQDTSPTSTRPEPKSLTAQQGEMLSLWRQVLGRDSLEVTDPASTTDFFSLGGTSLQLVGVQAAIRDRFHVSVPVVDLFKSSSIEAMTSLVVSGAPTESDEPNIIDWDVETRLPNVPIVPTGRLPSRHSGLIIRRPPAVVILTGATGFVGQAILRSLLASHSIKLVHCLAVRNPDRLGELRNNAKLVVHEGDLRHAEISLDPQTQDELAQTVDLIIHNGADVSFLKPYSALRSPNVSSTKFLATRLAAQRRIPITYISSAAVGRVASELEVFAPVSVANRPPPQGYQDAYGASKWASEVVLEKANRELGVPVVIRRLSSVTGAGIPDSDIMGNLLAFSEKLAAVPVTEKWKGVLDFVSVEHVAQAVVAEAMDGSHGDEVRYRHDCSEEVVPLDGASISRFVSRKIQGQYVAIIPMAEWIEKSRKAGMSDLVCTFLEQAERGSGVTMFQNLLRHT